MAWRLAKSLQVLRAQINTAHPDRSTKSDGTIGDANHQGTASDHNPNVQGVVCAFDLTHDPAHGVDGEIIVQAQRKNPHPDLAYMVWRGQIFSRIRDWKPAPNSGHYQHVHFSVGVGSDGKKKPPYDDTTLWDIGKESPMPAPLPPLGESKVLGVNDLGDGLASVWGQIACNVQGCGLWRFSLDGWPSIIPNGSPVFRGAPADTHGMKFPLFSVTPGTAELSVDVEGSSLVVTLTGAPSAAVYQLWVPVAKGK